MIPPDSIGKRGAALTNRSRLEEWDETALNIAQGLIVVAIGTILLSVHWNSDSGTLGSIGLLGFALWAIRSAKPLKRDE
jgi:TRAP-type mannitol/chloroaromatic compound transport system permease large subunit